MMLNNRRPNCTSSEWGFMLLATGVSPAMVPGWLTEWRLLDYRVSGTEYKR